MNFPTTEFASAPTPVISRIGRFYVIRELGRGTTGCVYLAHDPVVGDLAEGRRRRVELEGKAVLLYRHEGEVQAIGAVCSHQGGPLDEGEFDGNCVTCPWHQSVFDLRDGAVVHGPATYPQTAFEVRERGGRIEVRAKT